MTQRPAGRRSGICPLAGVVLFALTGCGTFLERGLLDPSQLWSGQQRTLEIRRAISELDEPAELVGATEPTPEDLVPYSQEYRLGPGDALTISIFELLQQGAETIIERVIDESGRIDIPVLGWIDVSGQTARELQEEIKAQLRQKQILLDPQVSVRVTLRSRQIYSVFGAVQAPGTYAIPRADFHLLEALIRGAGGLADAARMIYVIRSPLQPPGSPPTPQTTPGQGSAGPDQQIGGLTAAAMGSTGGTGRPAASGGSTAPSAGAAPTATSQPSSLPAIGPQERRELIEAIAPTGPEQPEPQPEQPEQRTAQAPPSATSGAAGGLSRWIYLNGEWVELPPKVPQAQTRPQAVPPALEGPPTQPVLEQAALAEEYQRRIIAIPADRLRSGEASYDIVVRPGDIIRVSAGPVGEFYMMGHVARPGAYQLTGRQISLKQAIAAAGGLGPLAWPARCEIIRRIGQDREQIIQVDLDRIFAGKDEDFFLKPDDIVNVGTHPITPFLAAIRTAFRVSYGFGFVYDRNFADIDSFYAQNNPRDRRRFERQTRFPGLFP